jgi:hypothetical protein
MTTIAGTKLVSMAKSKVSLKPGNVGKLSPDPYSYEHRITLDQDAMTKMGAAKTPTVGDVFHVMGEGHVHSVNSDGNGGFSVGLQMKKLGLKPKNSAGSKGSSTKAGAFDAVTNGIKQANE